MVARTPVLVPFRRKMAQIAALAVCLLLALFSERPIVAQDAGSVDLLSLRRTSFERRYREAEARGEADSPLWQDRIRTRLQTETSGSNGERFEEANPETVLRPETLSDRDALIALFQSTGGTAWFSKANWGSALPIEQWSDVVVEDGRVVALTLSDNNLVGPLPEEIGDLTALREFELDGNRISGSLPGSMAGMGSLKRLYLDANRVTGSLPQGLGTLPGLERLLLDDNLLDDLPDLSAASSALIFAVRRNRLTFEDFEPSIGFFDFRYAPQRPVGDLQTRDVSTGASITFQIPVGGANNQYRWYRNGVAIPGETSDTYAITSASALDAAVYVLEITNSVVTRPGSSSTNLILRSEPVVLRVDGVGPGEAPVAASDSVSTAVNTAVVIDVLSNDVDPQGDALTVTGIQNPPAHGTATLNLNSTITYTPAAGFEGTDTFEYAVADSDENTASALVLVRVGSGADNRAPIAVADSVETEVGQSVIITVLSNDSDPDGDALSLTGISIPPDHGSAVANADQTITYAPESGFSGEDAFTYSISDGFLSASARVVVQVGGPANRAPIAVDDAVETIKDNAVIIDVLANDTDADGDALAVSGFTETPSRGSVVVRGDGTVAYAPEAGFIGSDAFVYAITDGSSSASARVSVTVMPLPNPPPDAVDDMVDTFRDVPVEVDVLANDSDPNGDDLAIVGIGAPLFGSAVAVGQGTIRFTPAAGYSGPDSFTYQISDGSSTDWARVSIVVVAPAPANRPPIARRDQAVTKTGVPVIITVIENDSDLDGDPLSVTAVTLASNGATAVLGPEAVRYTPNAGFVGEDGFSYQITDGKVGANARIDVQVTPDGIAEFNLPPLSFPDAAYTDPGMPIELDVLANDSDPDGDPLTVTGPVSEPAFGKVEEVSQGTVRYTPNVGFLGTDVFEVGVSDGVGVSKAAVTIDVVQRPNAGPIAMPDKAETTAGLPVVVAVLNNDTDPDGDALELVGMIRYPQFGEVNLNADRTITYDPNPLFVAGVDQLEYEMSDGDARARAEVIITVSPPGNQAPQVLDDMASTRPGTPIDIEVLANDMDPDGDPLSVRAVVEAPVSGLATILPGGVVRYVPTASLVNGSDRFVIQVSDGIVSGLSAVIVEVSPSDDPANPPPQAMDDTATTPRNTSVDISVLANDTDPNSDPLDVVGLGLPRHGETVLAAEGVVRYAPPAGFVGKDWFDYQISDGVSTSRARVSVTVSPPEARNRAPVAYDDYVGTPVNTPVTVDVVANDADLDGNPLRVTAVTLAGNGVAKVNDDRSVTYTPQAGFVGVDSFSYQVTDGASGANGRVTVSVSASGTTNLAPLTLPDRLVTGRGKPGEVNVLANDADPEEDALEVIGVFRDPSSGRVSLFGNGRLVYTPNAGYAGYDRIEYGITDGTNTSKGVVHIEVTAQVNRVPLARKDVVEAPSGSPIEVEVLANDEDVDGDPIVVMGLTEFPAHGVANLSASGTILFTPVAGFAGFDGYSYRIGDGKATAEARVAVAVYAPVPVQGDRPPSAYSLGANYPNPFNPVTLIPFSLPTASHVRIDVFDLTGRRTATLIDESRPAGSHVVRFDAGNLSSGLYLYVMRSGDFVATGKLILVK